MRPALLALWLSLAGPLAAAPAADWVEVLGREVAAIDRDSPGALGVYVEHLGEGRSLSYRAERAWYLSSTVKVPVAIALLQLVEEGRLTLDEALTLQRSDYVDGAGDLLWAPPGSRYSLRELLGKMLENSDSTATDMLIRRIGEDELNRRIARMVPEGFSRFTTILQVRYDAYGLLHPGVAALSNMDFIRLKRAEAGEERLAALLDLLPEGEPRLASIEQAFERYYAQGLNSATLVAYAELLERLVAGELLSPPHTTLILEHMQRIRTGDQRLKAGLPAGLPFAQKTGTQLSRACNMGVLRPQGADAVVIAACVEKHGEVAAAEAALARVGAAIGAAGVLD